MARSKQGLKRPRGGIDELPSGAIRVRVYAGIDPVTKRRHYLQKTIPAGPKAEDLAEQTRVAFLHELYQRRHPRTNATVDQLLDRYFKERKSELEFNTYDTYVSYAKNHIRPLLGKEKVGTIDDGIMDSLYVELRRCKRHQECNGRRPLIDHRTSHTHECDDRCRPHECSGLSASAIRQIHFIMHGAYRKAIKWKWISHNPISSAEPPAAPKGNPRPPTPAEAARIVNEAFKDPDWGTLVWLTMTTGHRRGELCGIRWRHLDMDNGVLHLERAIGQRGKRTWEKATKAHQDRRITLDPDTVQLLAQHKERCQARAGLLGLELDDDKFVFARTKDGSAHALPDSVGQRFRKLAARLGIKTSIHKLRHYSATELIADGVNVRTVAGRLGHGGGGTTTLRTYTAWVSEADQRAAGNLARRMPKRQTPPSAVDVPDIVPSSPYERIAVELRDQILGGSLALGLALPPVKALAGEHGVSPSTALRAVQLLGAWGLVDIQSGRPTLVRQVLAPIAHAAPSEVDDQGDREAAGAEVLDLELRHLGQKVATFRSNSHPDDTAHLHQLLVDAIRRQGAATADIGEYELVVRYAGERGIATTYAASVPTARTLRTVN